MGRGEAHLPGRKGMDGPPDTSVATTAARAAGGAPLSLGEGLEQPPNLRPPNPVLDRMGPNGGLAEGRSQPPIHPEPEENEPLETMVRSWESCLWGLKVPNKSVGWIS